MLGNHGKHIMQSTMLMLARAQMEGPKKHQIFTTNLGAPKVQRVAACLRGLTIRVVSGRSRDRQRP